MPWWSASRLDHAIAAMVTAVDHLQLIAVPVAKQVEVVIDQIQLSPGLLEAHRRHGEILAADTGVGKLGLTALQQGAIHLAVIADGIRGGGGAGAVTVTVVVIAVTLLPAPQLTRQLAGRQVDAGVEVFAAFLGPNHSAIGEHRDFSGLLRNPGVAGDGKMHVRLADGTAEMVGGPLEFGLGVVPQGRRDLKVATMDQQLHASLLCRLISAN